MENKNKKFESKDDLIQYYFESYMETKNEMYFNSFYKRIIWGMRKFVNTLLSKNKNIYEHDRQELIDEILSTAFTNFLTSIHTYDKNKAKVSTWLYKIVYNTTLLYTQYKYNYDKSIVYFGDIAETEVDDYLTNYLNNNYLYENAKNKESLIVYNDYITKSNELLYEKVNILIEEHISKLSDKFRDIIIDRELNHLSYKNIVDKHNIDMPTVKNRILWGRRKLMNSLKNDKTLNSLMDI